MAFGNFGKKNNLRPGSLKKWSKKKASSERGSKSVASAARSRYSSGRHKTKAKY